MNDWQIRTAAEADVASVLSLWQAAEALPSATDTDRALRLLLARDRDSLVRTGEDCLRDLGAVRLTAIVADEERGATSLWQAMGYKRQPDRSRFVRVLVEDL